MLYSISCCFQLSNMKINWYLITAIKGMEIRHAVTITCAKSCKNIIIIFFNCRNLLPGTANSPWTRVDLPGLNIQNGTKIVLPHKHPSYQRNLNTLDHI